MRATVYKKEFLDAIDMPIGKGLSITVRHGKVIITNFEYNKSVQITAYVMQSGQAYFSSTELKSILGNPKSSTGNTILFLSKNY